MIPFNIIDSVFREQGLPLELKYLAVIESDLKSSARSHVGAVGPWQLMPGTARILGLKVTKRVDERKNYYKSTRAAARYLKDLYQEFGDWFLVLAAYNGGPGPVYTAIHKSGSRNFWALQAYLPRESRDHVKKFIATRYFFERFKTEPMPAANSVAHANTVPENSFAVYIQPQTAAKENTAATETSDEKFKRLMNASEASLKKSNATMDGK